MSNESLNDFINILKLYIDRNRQCVEVYVKALNCFQSYGSLFFPQLTILIIEPAAQYFLSCLVRILNPKVHVQKNLIELFSNYSNVIDYFFMTMVIFK